MRFSSIVRPLCLSLSWVVFFSSAFVRNAEAADPALPSLLTAENGFEGQPKDMMTKFLLEETARKKAEWREEYEKLKTVDEIRVYQSRRKEYMTRVLGQTWDRESPLNARVTKTFDKGTPGKDAYRVEMLLFESVPNFHVSGALYLPDPTRFQPPYPAVLVVCGHSNTGKAYELYQQVPALAASNGLVALAIDPIDQGERSQRLTDDGKPAAQGVAAHNLIGAGSILLGRNAATFELWDMIRAIDYLQSREDVIADKIGVTGTSGGGTQTSYIMVLDDRVAAAVPSCYLCNLFNLVGGIGPQDAEQNLFGQLAFGLDHADYCILRAPKPTLLETVTEDFFPVGDAWSACRDAKRIYDRFGFADRMSIIESEGKHGWHKNLREASVRWMLRWLADRDEPIFEAADMPITKVEDFRATPEGEVLKLPNARSAFDLNRDYNERLLTQRKERNEKRGREEFAEIVRKTAGIRSLDGIPEPVVESKGNAAVPAALAESAAKIEGIVFLVENGRVRLPAFRFVPRQRDVPDTAVGDAPEPVSDPSGTTVFLHEKGKTADWTPIEKALRSGREVLAVDLRGLGETQAIGPQYYAHALFGTDGTDYYRAYLLGKSYLGMRTEDLLTVVRWLRDEHSGRKIELVASGETVGLVALHAAVLEPTLFSSVEWEKPIRSWYDVVRAGDSFYPITNLVHGALLEYDVPELLRFFAEGQESIP